MVTNARGQAVMAGTGEPVTRQRINQLLDGVFDVRPVSSVVTRAQLVSDLTAAEQTPSEAAPLYAHRTDGPDLEIYTGSEWRAVGPPEVFVGPSPTGGVVTTSALALQLTVPAKPYKRSLMCYGSVYGAITAGTWDAALSVNQSAVLSAQRFARMSSGGDTAAMVLPFELGAGSVGTVRLWYRLISGSGSITATSGDQYTNLTVNAWRI